MGYGPSPTFARSHRARLHLSQTPHPLKRESIICLRNLVAYRSRHPVPPFPRSQCAAVLVALFVGRAGDLYVLLSRRASTLRSYAGDTALPGGKVDPEDCTIEDTARREAFEEIGLPRDRSKVPLVCVLEPFLTGNDTLVTPVVVLILDNTLRPIINTPEVASLFSHPLASFLAITAPFFADKDAEQDEENGEYTAAETAAVELTYHTHTDLPWPVSSSSSRSPETFPDNQTAEAAREPERWVRMHRFLTGREAGGIKPVFGLTAAILIRTASTGYARTPDFTLHAPHEPDMRSRIAWALRNVPRLREACVAGGLNVERTARAWEGRSRRHGRVREVRRAKL